MIADGAIFASVLLFWAGRKRISRVMGANIVRIDYYCGSMAYDD